MADKVLVTGGCGVLGSAIVDALKDWGMPVIVIDSLERSSRPPDNDTYIGDFADSDLLLRVLTDHPDLKTVIHAAAYISPEESVREPAMYLLNNVLKTHQLITFLQTHKVHNFIFSSSAAVYGDSPDFLLSESVVLRPASPYAESKVFIERDLAAVSLRSICLRYFNPITSAPGTVLHSIFQAAVGFKPFWVNGDDWGTSDGSTIRDFVSVKDLALAHVYAVARINSLPVGTVAVNIGSGQATPILGLAKTVEKVTGLHVPIRIGPRRDGDIRGGAADIGRAAQLLSWKPRQLLEDSVAEAWERFK